MLNVHSEGGERDAHPIVCPDDSVVVDPFGGVPLKTLVIELNIPSGIEVHQTMRTQYNNSERIAGRK